MSARFSVDPGASGLLAARPAANGRNKGTFYSASDTGQLFLSTGSAWTTLFVGSNSKTGYLSFASYAPASDTTDASAAVTQFLTDCIVQGKMAYFGKRRIYLPSVVNQFAAGGLKIEGDGPDATVFYHDGAAYMFDLRGGTYDTTASLLTVQANPGDLTVTMASTARVTAGQWINLQSDKIWDATSGKAARQGERIRVKQVTSGTVLTLYSPVEDTYLLADSARVNYSPMSTGFAVRGVGFERTNPLTNTSGALVARFMQDFVIEDVNASGLDGPALTYISCIQGTAARCNFRDMADDEANSRFGYGHNVSDDSRDITIAHGHSRNIRHHVTTSATSASVAGGVPRHVRVVGCSGTAHTNAVFSTHEEGYDVTFDACEAYASQDMGYELRAPHSRLVGCRADNLLGTGVIVQAACTDAVIQDFTATNLRGTGSARGNPCVAVSIAGVEATVDGLKTNQTGDSAVLISGVNRQTIKNARLQGWGKAGVNKSAIRFSGSSIDHQIENVTCDGEGLSGTALLFAAVLGNVTGMKVSALRGRRVSSAVSNIANLDVKTMPGTGVTDFLVDTPHSRTTTATSTTMLQQDHLVGVTDTTALRTITLPAANAVAPGVIYRVVDESGAAATNNITIARAGTDTIVGGATSTTATITTNGGARALYSDGTSKWFVV
jgi:hypothetical protein